MPVQTTPSVLQHPMRRFLEISLIPVRSIISNENRVGGDILKTRYGASYKISDCETVRNIAASFMCRKMEECNIEANTDKVNFGTTVCISHPDPEVVGRITLVLEDNIYDQIEEDDNLDIMM